MARTLLKDFQLANPIYKGATVTVYTVVAGIVTALAATLYAAPTGAETLSNPVKLDSRGKQKQAIYIDTSVVASVAGAGVPVHSTGIIGTEGGAAIISGTIDGTVIGGTTPAAGTFTSLTATSITINGVAGTKSMLKVGTGSTTQQGWHLGNLGSGTSGLWGTRYTPDTTNYILSTGTNNANLNAPTASGIATLQVAGVTQFAAAYTVGAVNYAQATGNITGFGPAIAAVGTDTNIDFSILTKGLGSFYISTGGGTGFQVQNVPSTVNTLRAYGGAAGGAPGITAVGETNTSIQINSTGTGSVFLGTRNGTGQVEVIDNAGTTNRLQLRGSNGGAPVITTSAGNLTIAPAGGTTTVSGALNITTDCTTAGSLIAKNATATAAGGAVGVSMGTAGVRVAWGSGVPTLSAAQGSIYLRTDGSSTSTRLYVNTDGSTGWTAITTAT